MSGTGSWLEKFSNEYNVVYSNIASCLTNAKVIVSNAQVWKIDNPSLKRKFDTAHGNSVLVESWLNARDIFLGTEDEILSSIHGGFAFPSGTGGMQFSTGHLVGIDAVMASNGDIDKTFGFIMCTMAIGRSYVVDNNTSIMEIPEGYDSVHFLNGSNSKR